MATKNLYTDGSEFTLPNGRRYRGYYHVHPTKGAMVGGVHVNRFHELLSPINRLVKKKMESRSEVRPPAPPRTSVVRPPAPPSTPVVPPPITPQVTSRPTTTRPVTTRPIVTSTPSGGGGGGY
tara:strand:- start:397 stop:765 length:369 start_codon:yes stop_codon:yes gene_type:complete